MDFTTRGNQTQEEEKFVRILWKFVRIMQHSPQSCRNFATLSLIRAGLAYSGAPHIAYSILICKATHLTVCQHMIITNAIQLHHHYMHITFIGTFNIFQAYCCLPLVRLPFLLFISLAISISWSHRSCDSLQYNTFARVIHIILCNNPTALGMELFLDSASVAK